MMLNSCVTVNEPLTLFGDLDSLDPCSCDILQIHTGFPSPSLAWGGRLLLSRCLCLLCLFPSPWQLLTGANLFYSNL